MKKLLSLFSSLTMVSTTLTTSTLTVACEGAYSRQIYNVLDLDRENFFNWSEFNYDTMCPPIYYMGIYSESAAKCSSKEEEFDAYIPVGDGSLDTFFETSYQIRKYVSDLDDSKNYNISLSFGKAAIEMYSAASSWFDNLLSNNQETWARIVYNDVIYSYEKQPGEFQSKWFTNGKDGDIRVITSELDATARRSLLTLLGDTITSLEFQRNVARFSVLRKNLNILYEGYLQAQTIYNQAQAAGASGDKLLELGVFLSELKVLISDVSVGKFIPLIKLVASGTARSLGNSQVSIDFDSNLVSYLSVGNMTQSNILAYYSTFPNKVVGTGENQIVYQQPTTQEIITFASKYRDGEDGNSSASDNIERYIADFNLRAISQLYLYGYSYKSLIENTLGNK